MKRFVALVAPVLLAGTAAQAAAVVSKDLPRGTILPSVECLASPGQNYALYLPSNYSPNRSWPILYGFDAGGRGITPVRLFREAAERHGIVLVGSNNFTSRKRRSVEAMKTLDALYRDTNTRFVLDPKRVYAGGYSGGARISWTFEFNTPDLPLAGIIAVGAGLPETDFPAGWDGKDFSFFGMAGDVELNYYRMVDLDESLAQRGVARRFATFPGGHVWAPKTLCTMALDWMQVQAMRRNLVPRDETFLKGFLEEELRRARGLEGESVHLAHRAYSELSRDLKGIIDIPEVDARIETLEAGDRLSRSLEKEEEARKQAAPRLERALSVLESIGQARKPKLEDLLSKMGAARLIEKARDPDRETALANSRVLETVFSRAVARFPRQLRRSGQLENIPICLRIATHLKPNSPLAWYGLAQAEAEVGEVKKALDALQQSIDYGLADGELIAADPLLRPLKGQPRFREILRRLGVPTDG